MRLRSSPRRVAMINMRSGNTSDCQVLLDALIIELGNENVFNLAETSPLDIIAAKRPDEVWSKLFVCGGDGTVAWVLSALDEFRFDKIPRPVVAVIPMGTGNDLSRALGWGPGFTSNVNVRQLLESIDFDGNEELLDRWRVVVTSLSAEDSETPIKSSFYTLNNYASFGCDAFVTSQFAQLRESLPALCSSRLGNKVLYTLGGTGAFFQEHVPLDKVCKLKVDGARVAIPPDVYGLMILNISSYAAGANLWGSFSESKFDEQRMDDGLIEVVGVSGTFHLGSSAVGLSEGVRIAQGASLALSFISDQPIYYQLDGEAAAEPLAAPAVVRIRALGTDPCKIMRKRIDP